jgi:hypothetical protein
LAPQEPGMKNYLMIAAALVICTSCSDKKKNDSEDSPPVFDRLIGTWRLAEEEQFERWIRNEDGSFSSRMYSVTGNDTTILEEVNVVKDGDKWNFITLVKGQNKGKAVTFTSTILQDTIVQFENPSHDFPRIINYRIESDHNMQAFIAGTSDTIYFNFSKVIGK